MARQSSVVIALFTCFLAGVVSAAEGSALDPEEALKQVYGGPVWESKQLARHFRESAQTRAFVTLAFSASFTEGGQQKTVVVAKLTPKPLAEYQCHACLPLIGGAVFVRAGDAWQVESRTHIIDFGSAWGSRFSVAQIGPDRYGVLHHREDGWQ